MNTREKNKQLTNKDIDLLVIGGDSYLARSFIKKTDLNCKIQAISRVKTGYYQEFICDDFFSIPIEYFERSIRVINFVGIAHRYDHVSKSEYVKINGELPIFLAGQSKASAVRYFVQMSSISIFGSKHLINNKSNLSPLTDYGKSKLFAEIGLDALQDSSFHVLSLRPPMIYGPGAPGNLDRLLKLSDTPYPLPFGRLRNRRDFLYVDNFVKILDAVFREEVSGKILVSENNPLSTTYLVVELRKALKRKQRLFHINSIARVVIKRFFPLEFEKLFSDNVIDPSCIPEFIKNIGFYSPEIGIHETVAAYQSKQAHP
jgi:UDP-glucose 4-epimerase